MVQGYDPVIKALARNIDIRLNHRYCCHSLQEFINSLILLSSILIRH